MSFIDTESTGGPSGSLTRTTGTGADRQSGRWRRRIRIGIATSAAAAVAALATPQVVYRNDPYADNLKMIYAQPWRNTTMDNSTQKWVEQDQLDISVGGPLIDTNRAAYLGNPGGNSERAFPVPEGGQFRIGCEFSHFAYDDPILYPRSPGFAHLHMFYGNTDINAYSTYDTMVDSGSSTCNGGEANRTGYWAPAVIDPDPNAPGGAWVRIPERIVVYYKGYGRARGRSLPYKPGMANIANWQNPPGRYVSVPELASFNGGDPGEVNFKCSNNFSAFPEAAGGGTGVNQIPNCNGDYWRQRYGATYPGTRMVLEMSIKLWNCFPKTAAADDYLAWGPSGPTRGSWFFSNCDGTGGQGAGAPPLNDKDTYPNIDVFVNYVVMPNENTSDWYLSSDVAFNRTSNTWAIGQRGGTLHTDWWGGWVPSINRQWLDNCTNAFGSDCGFGYLTNGGPNGAAPLPGPTLKMRPQYDTQGDSSDYRIPLQDVFNRLCSPLNPGRSYLPATPASGALCLNL